MSNKEEKAKEYRLKTVLNTERYLEGGSNIEKAYIAGWDAAIDKACEWLENNLVRDTSIITCGYGHINFGSAIKKFREYFKEELL